LNVGRWARGAAVATLLMLSWQGGGTAVAASADVALDGSFVQGGLVNGRVSPGSAVWLDDRPLRVGADGSFVFGFGRDQPKAAVLRIRDAAGRETIRPLDVGKRNYEVQRIDGLPRRMVTPDPDALERIRRENARIAEVRRRDTDSVDFRRGFMLPVEGPITGVYGSQRILNGEPRQPHYGIDIAAPEGTPVLSPAAGSVALAERDLYYTGGTVMIDHGFGITSVLSHLRTVDVVVGDRVDHGTVVGTVGATGRATGAHLDWRVNWFEVRLDPALLVPVKISK
jgi:murein DD-endopeptidase MepM/ murein hydrolase activator NlpD